MKENSQFLQNQELSILISYEYECFKYHIEHSIMDILNVVLMVNFMTLIYIKMIYSVLPK